MEDNSDEFPLVAHITDAMLRKVDPKHPVLMAYLKTINTSIETGVLLPKFVVALPRKARVLKRVLRLVHRRLLLNKWRNLLKFLQRKLKRNLPNQLLKIFLHMQRRLYLRSLGYLNG